MDQAIPLCEENSSILLLLNVPDEVVFEILDMFLEVPFLSNLDALVLEQSKLSH